jgi:hypothetical protein
MQTVTIIFRRSYLLIAVILLASCTSGNAQRVVADRFLADIETLAADEMNGRLVGTEGSVKAQRYILDRYEEIGLAAWRGEHRHTFKMQHRDGRDIDNATNLIGVLEGTAKDGRYIVITAHYDHLGEHDGKIFNGADDNASGVAGLLAAAAYFKSNPLPVGLIFAALDAEEGGLRGAHALVAQMDSLGMLDSVVMNINMDMISVSEAGELSAVGTYHYPFLKPVIEAVASESRVKLLMGHDSPDLKPGDDWTNASDHAAFHRKGIPFIYFGVEDHAWYHTADDTFDKVTKEFAVGAAETVILAIKAFGMMESVGTR